MKVLVTGASGFVGRHLTAKLLEEGHEVVGVQRSYPEKMQEGLQVIPSDVTDMSRLQYAIDTTEPDKVVHLAAQAIVSRGLEGISGTFYTNIIGTANVLEICEKKEIPVFYFSTDKVMGNRLKAEENDALRPVEPYGISKASADMLTQQYDNTTVGRACNLYGFDLNSRIIPNTIRSCLAGESPIIFEPTKHSTRQYIYVEDAVDGILFLIKKELEGVFHIGTEDWLTQEETVKTICGYFDVDPVYIKERKTLVEAEHQSLSWEKMKNLGWHPKFTFKEGIEKTIEAFKRWYNAT